MAVVQVRLRNVEFLIKIALFFFFIFYMTVVIFLLGNTCVDCDPYADGERIRFRSSDFSDLSRLSRNRLKSGCTEGGDVKNPHHFKDFYRELEVKREVFRKKINESEGVHEANESKNVTMLTDSLSRKLYHLAKGCNGDACSTFWTEVDGLVDRKALYPDHFDVDIVLDMLRTAKITDVKEFTANTAYKWLLLLEGRKQALFKLELEHPGDEVNTKGCNAGYEGPKYEVAAFHLYRIAGSRNAPFATGRMIDIKKEIYPLAPEIIRKTIEVHDNGTACIIHKCYYCNTARRFCFHDGHVRGAMIFWIDRPFETIKGPINLYHPFHPICGNISYFQYDFNDRRHCDYVRTIMPFNEPTHFLDMVDLSALNYMMANFDEKYLMISGGNSELVLHIDHGLGYCMTHKGYMNLTLAILYQCCTIRLRLIQQLQRIDDAIRTNKFNQLTRHDVLFPLLTPLQLKRTRNRINDVMRHVERCRWERSPVKVVLRDDSLFDEAWSG